MNIRMILLGFIFPLLCYGQEKSSIPPKWEIGLSFGGMQFMRGYNSSNHAFLHIVDHWAPDINPGFGGNVKYYLSPVFSFKGEYLYGTLSGYFSDQKHSGIIDRNRTFETRVHEADLNLLIDFFNLFSRDKQDRNFTTYGKVGIGAGFLHDRNKEIENPTSVIVPTGLGIDFRVSNRIRLNAEGTFHWGSDYLDAMLEKNGEDSFIENYVYTGISIAYRLDIGKGKRKEKYPEEISPAKTIVEPEMEKGEETGFEPAQETSEQKIKTKPMEERELPREPQRISADNWPVSNGAVFGELPVSGVTYRVQIIALKEQEEPDEKFINLFLEYGKLYRFEGDGYIKYAIGKFNHYRDAQKLQKELNNLSDEINCFIVAFKDDLQLK